MDLRKHTPPKYFLQFFRWFCHPELRNYIEGDLLELYYERCDSIGKRRADVRFVVDVLLLFRPGIIRPTEHYENINQYAMFRNYFKIAIRTFAHNKSYSFVNVTGLALGLAASMVIFLVVRNELSYDRFHQKADRTYRVTVHGLDYNPSVSFAVAPAFRNDFPEAEHVSQYWYQRSGLVKVGDDRYNEQGFAFADNEFTQVFDFTWLAGNPKTALKEPNAVVLTESMAKKYFGMNDRLGKIIRLENTFDLQVTGVIKDLPPNTHLSFIFLVSWETVKKEVNSKNFWAIQGGNLYVTLPDKLSEKHITSQLNAFIQKNWGEDIAKGCFLILQPMTEIHFDQRYIKQITTPRSRETIYGLAAVSLFIILSACINFVNLATAQSLKRLKEIGIRKTLGAYRKQVITQGLTETSLLVILAGIVAFAVALSFLPTAQSLLGIKVDRSYLFEPDFFFVLAGVTVMTILLAGLYPALIQSGFQPIKALKSGTSGDVSQKSYLRKGLVVVQFAITQILIVGTMVAGSQMNFFLNQHIGFDKEAIVTFSTGRNTDVLHQRLQHIQGIQEISFASAAPAYNSNFAPFSSPALGMTEVDVTEIKEVDENYMPMFKIELLAGNAIAKSNPNDTVVHVVVNETLIKRLGITDPAGAIDQQVFIGKNPVFITGVVRDFQSESKHKKIRACIILYNPNHFWQASVKLRTQNMHETLASINKTWSELNPESLFSYEFMDEHIANMYKQEAQMYTTFRFFAAIAIVIGCLGLYGLVSLMGAQRTKEIGIRKVLGASVSSVVTLFFRQFLWLILLAFVVAAPLAWFAMRQWLEEFAYHIDINLTIFAVSLIVTFIISGVTISYQSIKAALANPVTSLRSE
jgi:putative ABC transport system permease protein